MPGLIKYIELTRSALFKNVDLSYDLSLIDQFSLVYYMQNLFRAEKTYIDWVSLDQPIIYPMLSSVNAVIP